MLGGILCRVIRLFILALITGLAFPGLMLAQTFPLAKAVQGVGPGNVVDTGSNFTYRITYNCASTTNDCDDIVVLDVLPADLEFVSVLATGDVATVNAPAVGTLGTGLPGGPQVEFIFNTPLAAGSAGDLDITVRFRNGSTPDGTTRTNTATATGTNVPPSTSNPVDVTANATFMPRLQKSLSGGQALLGFDSTYNITVGALNNSGSLNVSAVTVVDTLPAGAIFVSANNGGAYDAIGHTVTWDNGGAGFSATVSSPLNLQVTVRYESPPFNDGDMVTNTVNATMTPLGGSPQAVGPVGLTHDVEAFVETPVLDLDKRLGGGYPSPALGQTFLYDVLIENDGNIPLDSITVTDTVPAQLDVVSVSTGDYNSGYTGLVTISYSTNLGGPSVLGSSPGNTNANFPIPALAAGEYVTSIEWAFAGPIPVGMRAVNNSNRARVEATLLATDNLGNPVNTGDSVQNCIDGTAPATLVSGPTAVMDSDCHSFNVSEPFTYSSPNKRELSGGPYIPGQTVSFEIEVDNQTQASEPLVNAVVTDLLPAGVQFVAASETFAANGTGVTVANFEVLPNFDGAGSTLLRWTLSGTIAPGQNIDVRFDAEVLTGVISGTLTNTGSQTHNTPGVLVRCSGGSDTDTLDQDGDASTADRLCRDNENFTIAAVAQLTSEKLVQGQCDVGFTKFPNFGVTVPGGLIDYRETVTNVGTVPVTGFVIVDILPEVGDTGVLDLNPRDSFWAPILVGPITPPPGGAVFYSTSPNPCRPEVGGPVSGCDPPGWTTVPPSPISSVRAFKVEFGSRVLNPLDTLDFQWRMIAPSDVPLAASLVTPAAGDIAWNSFGYQGTRVDGGTLNAEPLKVGIIAKAPPTSSLGDFVWLDTNGNGIQDDGPTGVNDVPVRLYSPGPDGVAKTGDDVLVANSITADDMFGNPGWYLFSDLTPASYYVEFTPPTNFDVTAPDQGGNDALDSDVDPLLLCTPLVSLGPGEDNPTLDLGLLPPTTASLGNYVWFDLDADGVQDEPVAEGVNGVTVELYEDADGDGTPEPGGDDGPPVEVQATADDAFAAPGYYLFEDLPPGGYFVRFVLPPSATGFTSRDAGGDDSVDSDADTGGGINGGSSAVVVLVAGDANLTLDAGLIRPSGSLALGNLVWCDDNGDLVADASDDNGVFDPGAGESGVNGVRLNLYRDDNSDGLPQPGEYFGSTLTFTQAGNDGRYAFANLPAGDYVVEVAALNFLSGGPLEGKSTATGNSPAPDPDDDVDNDDNADLTGAVLYNVPVTLSNGGEPTNDGDGDNDTNLSVDFGFRNGSAATFDYGDAPDAGTGTGPGNYATTALDGGPYHELIASNPLLGDCVDADTGSAQNIFADADDLGAPIGATVGSPSCVPGGDDEDGVTFTSPFSAGSVANFTVRANSTAGAVPCTLNAWVDWNQSGVFEGSEQIAADVVIASGGSTVLSPAVPVGAPSGWTYARFRCSTAAGLPPTGPAPDGEVEDHLVRVVGIDYGDAPDSYTTLAASGGPSHPFDPGVTPILGACVDGEADAPAASLNGLGDDLTFTAGSTASCADDEDGVRFDTMFVVREAAQLTVTASLPSLLSAWIDWNGDGQFTGIGEQIANDQALLPGANVLNLVVPADATVGITYARFRVSTAGVGTSFGGAAADGEVEDYALVIKGNDYGDAPDSYTTTEASGGPRHGVDPTSNLYLGTCADTETDAQAPFDASGDDANAGSGTAGTCTGGDDEDGVVFTSMVIACQVASVQVTAGSGGRLDAWIDFNRDGDFGDLGEQVFLNRVLGAGANNLSVAVPCNAVPGASYSRWRFSSTGGLGIGGFTMDGEVEDHPLQLKAVDFGDAPASYGTLASANGPTHGIDPAAGFYLGSCVDTEVDGAPSAGLDGDDLTSGTTVTGSCSGGDDEDGVSFPGGILVCQSADVEVTASLPGVLDAWIDFNGDGDFADADEQVFTFQAVAAGTQTLSFSVPCGLEPRTTASRWRLSSTGGLSFTGPSMDGEVEDHPATLEAFDYGDLPDSYATTTASGGAVHALDPASGLFLGACVDAEGDGQNSVDADGDDLGAADASLGTCSGNDDEDGVTFATDIIACESADLTVVASATGLLDAWIDFGADGDFSAATDRILTGFAVSAGSQTVSFTVPCDTVGGDTYARFRLSTTGVAGSGGPAADGEVEDYVVNVQLGRDFGDAPDPAYPTTLAQDGARHFVLPTGNPTLGSLVDSELEGLQSANHLGDDQDGSDDEDGVSFFGALIPGADADIELRTGATGGVVSAWVDFNLNGSWNDPGEQVVADLAMAANSTSAVTFPVPVGSPDGSSCARIRISSAGGLTPTGQAADGEVEDYVVAVGVEDPKLGVAKEVITFVDEGGGAAVVTFAVRLENLGNVPLSNVNANADLATAFQRAAFFQLLSLTSSDFVVNTGFDGDTVIDLLFAGNNLGVGESGTVELEVRVNTGGVTDTYECSSIGTGTSPAGSPVTDTSQDGGSSDPDGNGDPGDNEDPTIVQITGSVLEIPTLGEWGLILLVLLLATAALRSLRRRRRLQPTAR